MSQEFEPPIWEGSPLDNAQKAEKRENEKEWGKRVFFDITHRIAAGALNGNEDFMQTYKENLDQGGMEAETLEFVRGLLEQGVPVEDIRAQFDGFMSANKARYLAEAQADFEEAIQEDLRQGGPEIKQRLEDINRSMDEMAGEN